MWNMNGWKLTYVILFWITQVSGKHVQGINHKGPIIKTDNWKIQTNLVWKQILMNRSATVTLNSWINVLVGDFVNYASQVMSFTHMFGRINNYKTP